MQLTELNQDTPRLLKQNLMFYKVAKVAAGQVNSALITEDGQLLLQGMNDHGQLGIGNPDLGKALFFLGEFMKKDFFHERKLKVVDVSFGAYHTLVLAQDRPTGKRFVFGCGSSEFGQLCKQTSLISYGF